MKHRISVFATIAIIGLSARNANAQFSGIGGSGPAPGASGPSSGRPDVTPTPETDDGPVPLAPNSVKLFDAYRSTLAYQLDIGPIWIRRASNTTPITRREGFIHEAPGAGELSLGSMLTTPSKRGPFYLASEQLTTFRVLDSKSFAWSIFAEKFGGGIALGPIEIDGKIGIDLLTVDIMHAQPSVDILTPIVEAGVGLHFGKFRLDIKGHSEYLWRWFGPDYFIRGVTIGLRLDRTRPKNPFPGAPPE